MRGVWAKADRFDWLAAPPLSLVVRTPTAAGLAIEAQPGALSRAQPPKRSGHTLLHSVASVAVIKRVARFFCVLWLGCNTRAGIWPL
jgi:hypothetical protein